MATTTITSGARAGARPSSTLAGSDITMVSLQTNSDSSPTHDLHRDGSGPDHDSRILVLLVPRTLTPHKQPGLFATQPLHPGPASVDLASA
ncbi:hypothetical protein PG997_013677 [Apiospora hydei]|uniref:Uncharacterized protein n=1 Tax=Apiospora hydei TaxID=1337664 RepID=A0ABR1V6Z3_9PEZI